MNLVLTMKQIIKSITVNGLWDIKDISVTLNEDVNIFIGGNGTGKTTLLKIVAGILNVDLQTIDDIYFNDVIIAIQTEEHEENRQIRVQKISEDPITSIYRYFFSDEIVDIRLSDIRMFSRLRNPSSSIYHHIKTRIENLINLSWLSINRTNEYLDRRINEELHDSVDAKLQQLMTQIVSYRLQLETKVNSRTKKFNEDLVSLLLYNDTYDTLPKYENLMKIQTLPTDEIITQLHRVFSYFGDPRLHTDDIQKHAEKIQSVVEKVTGKEQTIDAKELLALSLLNRTVAIFSLSSDYQKERADIMEPLKKYVDIVSQYLKDKVLEFDESTGEFSIILKYRNNKNRKLSIYSLSSGERQLLILLTETLLQQQRPFIFIADEPELSLHIEWQRNLINSIRELNPNAQIIFATHAPEIAANHSKKLINMQNVTTYAEE